MAASVMPTPPAEGGDGEMALKMDKSTFYPMPTVNPALSPSVQESITIVYTAIYALLFLFVYVQLWMIWYYRHKRFSYQTVFLFSCLVWSGLRTTLFSFYFKDCGLANDLPVLFYWLLYCFPVCLQFTMLCLLVLFFAQVVFKARAKYEPSKYKKPLRVVIIAAMLVFTLSNLACALVVRLHENKYNSIPIYLLYVRVAINDSLFVIFAIALSVCMFRMTKMSSSSLVLEAKGTSVCQAVVVSVLIIALFTSRAVYNFITVSPSVRNLLPGFGYDWVNVSDQVDTVKNLSETFAYVSFGVVLFVWEVLPISLVIIFFRVKRQSSAVAMTDFSTSSRGSKVFFFDNPRRYDSDDDLSQVDPRTRSPHESGSYSINYSGSHRGTPITTPHGTPVTHGSHRSSILGAHRPASYGAVFSGGGTPGSGAVLSAGTPGSGAGSVTSRAVMSTRVPASPVGARSLSGSVMTPPPHAILSTPPTPHIHPRQAPSLSRDCLLRSQEVVCEGQPVC